jgi:predicted phosphodiesterase
LARGVHFKLESRRKQKTVAAAMKVFVVSDVHTDYKANMEWVRSLSLSQYSEDTLICAGDVSDNLETFQTTMALFKDKYRDVFFVPGNHDLWCRRKEDHVRNMLPSPKCCDVI